MLITVVLVRGIRESAWFNTAMVGAEARDHRLLHRASAPSTSSPRTGRRSRPTASPASPSAAAIIFFAYIGFDAVSTAAEESSNPQRDMPIAHPRQPGRSARSSTSRWRSCSPACCRGTQLGTAEPLATAFSALGMNWPALVISLGAVFATTSVLLVFQLGQPRIFFSMARDGLLPAWAAQGPPEVPHAARHDLDHRHRSWRSSPASPTSTRSSS